MTNIQWDQVTEETIRYTRKILERAESLGLDPVEKDRPGLCMDLEAASLVVDIDYEQLLTASDVEFAHDVLGIYRHFNRDTGVLDEGFAPRFAREASGGQAPAPRMMAARRKKQQDSLAAWRGRVPRNEALAALSESMREGHVVASHELPGQSLFHKGRGTPIGCLVRAFGSASEPKGYAACEALFGIPEPFAEMIDTLYDRLPGRLAAQWPQRMLEAMPEGEFVRPGLERWLAWLIADTDSPIGMSESAGADCYAKREAGSDVADAEWEAARDQARKRAFACTDGYRKESDPHKRMARAAVHQAWMACVLAATYELGEINSMREIAQSAFRFGVFRAKARNPSDVDAPKADSRAFAEAMSEGLLARMQTAPIGQQPDAGAMQP